MKYCIVVARYMENVEWTKLFSNVIIYNKGIPLGGDYNEILLNNVGREGHTYYKHIYDNYENLSDYTIFLQGNPFDHSPIITDDLNTIINSFHTRHFPIDFEFLSRQIESCNLSGCRFGAGMPLKDVYEKLFNEKKKDMEFKFGVGAQFIVSKKKILQKPKNFYLKIIEMLDKSVNPLEGHVIERFHSLIFNSPNECFGNPQVTDLRFAYTHQKICSINGPSRFSDGSVSETFQSCDAHRRYAFSSELPHFFYVSPEGIQNNGNDKLTRMEETIKLLKKQNTQIMTMLQQIIDSK